eukprot:1149247-Pelagomonas_calceolata.AAC.1
MEKLSKRYTPQVLIKERGHPGCKHFDRPPHHHESSILGPPPSLEALREAPSAQPCRTLDPLQFPRASGLPHIATAWNKTILVNIAGDMCIAILTAETQSVSPSTA